MISDDRVEWLRRAAERARANGDPEKYLACLTVQQAHDIAACLSELQKLRAQPAVTAEQAAEAVWGTMMHAIKS
jgi:hypothetical protein